jgi:glycosyltransferase involved in cell wall biosynthesis
MPRVSICLPNLNNAKYLHERFDTIRNQTFQDWECIVSDNYSDDGAWDIIQSYAARDPRIICFQSPKDQAGMYPNWNHCLNKCQGEYVYVATSDDTMADDCLEKLMDALDRNPHCGIAHCNLRAIGDGADEFNCHWAEGMLFAKSSGSLRTQKHIRKAPYDALLQLSGHTVYISITQLLIRRDLFDEIGGFDGRWGSAGDFHWHMRACFRTDTVHVPDTWGGWRLHASQATSLSAIDSPPHRAKIEQMIDDALCVSWVHLPKGLQQGLQSGWRNFFYDKWFFHTMIRNQNGKFAKAWFLTKCALSGSKAARDSLLQRVTGKSLENLPPHEIVSGWLEALGNKSPLIKVV